MLSKGSNPAMSAIQAYVRTTAPRGRETERVGPFLATYSPGTSHPMLNYAIPDGGLPAPRPAPAAGVLHRRRSRPGETAGRSGLPARTAGAADDVRAGRAGRQAGTGRHPVACAGVRRGLPADAGSAEHRVRRT